MSDDRRHKCSVTDGKLTPCSILDEALDGVNVRRKGLQELAISNIHSGKVVKSGAVVHSGKFVKKGIVLNFCPFCGEDIGSQFKAEGEEAAS